MKNGTLYFEGRLDKSNTKPPALKAPAEGYALSVPTVGERFLIYPDPFTFFLTSKVTKVDGFMFETESSIYRWLPK